MTAAIIVAGGRSRRFGSDKLRHRIGGSSLLERTVRAASVCSPVVVVTASHLSQEQLATDPDVPDVGAVIAVSEHPRWGGPCAALGAALEVLAHDNGEVIVLPADLSDPDDAVTALLGIAEGVLTDEDGRPQWLLARASLQLLRGRVTQLRSQGTGLAGLPASAVMAVVTARAIAPQHAIHDIDTPADLQDAGRPQEELAHGSR